MSLDNVFMSREFEKSLKDTMRSVFLVDSLDRSEKE